MVGDNCSILVVDDDRAFRSFVSELFAAAGFSTAEARTGDEALAVARRSPPAVVVVEVRLPDVSGFEVCQRLRASFGEALSIVFVSRDRTDPLDRATGMLVGGDDYIVKPVDADELLARVRRLIARSEQLQAASRRAVSDASLTERELDVLQLLALGRGSKEIARELVISPKTVASHIQHILGKLGAHSRTEAVAIAYRDGLVGDQRENGSSGRDVTAHMSAASWEITSTRGRRSDATRATSRPARASAGTRR